MQHLTITRRDMAKIRNKSTPEKDANLPKRQRSSIPESFGDEQIGSGGKRTRTDGVQVNGRSISDDKGWHASR